MSKKPKVDAAQFSRLALELARQRNSSAAIAYGYKAQMGSQLEHVFTGDCLSHKDGRVTITGRTTVQYFNQN